MAIIQSRRRFVTNAAMAGAAGLGGFGVAGLAVAGENRSPRSRRRKSPRSASKRIRSPALRRSSGRGAAARRGLYRYPLCRTDGSVPRESSNSALPTMIARGEVDFAEISHHLTIAADGWRRSDHNRCRLACRVLRGVRQERHPQHRRPEGQDGGCALGGATTPRLLSIMASLVGLDPRKDIHWVSDPSAKSDGPLHRGEDRCVPGRVRPIYRNSAPATSAMSLVSSITDRPWSQYFCCMLASQHGVCPANIRLRPSGFCAPF